MRSEPRTRPLLRLLALRTLIGATLAVALPLQAIAASIELATVPMATSTTTTVKPNVMYVLDDSGSMDWDYLPDVAKNFAGKYGFNSSQCNGNYYNPNVTYGAPIKYDGTPLNTTPTSFTAAYKDGYNTSAGTVDLSTAFKGGSMAGASGISLSAGPAFYYTYSGTQTTEAQKTYFTTGSTFYTECNSNIGSNPGAGVFTLVRLASVPTTTLTVTAPGGAGASITITNAGTRSNPAKVSSVKVTLTAANGGTTIEILKAATNSSRNTATLAGYLAAQIHACFGATLPSGNCGSNQYDATNVSGTNVVNITGPANSAGATFTTITMNTGSQTNTPFPTVSTTNVGPITVGGTDILAGATATGSNRSGLATDIAAKVTASGYSATAAGNVVTVTGPTSASNLTPAVTIQSPSGTTMSVSALQFPESTPAKLQNFANWFSYYSTRMLMMKTGSGLAFNQVTDKYRVGFLTMNNNVSPGIVEVDTFDTNQRLKWYTKLYAANPSNSTPLREVLSRVGQYYAHKFGQVDRYTATITVGGSGATSVSSITVNGVELMKDDSLADASTSQVAKNIAAQINAPLVTDFGASASGNVITITGPANVSGSAVTSFTPIVSDDGGGMTFTRTAFVKTTTTSQLNGITPADPIQYSCQQNFTILSTDGYWNGPNTYDLNNNAVGQVDGTAARPYNDGAQSQTTYTNYYKRTTYSRTSSSGSCGSGRPLTSATKSGSCNVTTQSANCTPSSWTTSSYTAVSPQQCVSSSGIPADTNWVVDTSQGTNGQSVTTGTVGGVSNTLADVALYYYHTDLRDNSLGNCTGALGTSVCENNVFISGTDNNTEQHMTTFTLGLGVRGSMVYSSSYLTDSTGDYVAVKNGLTASASVCTWQTAGTVCTWPVPTSGSKETTDDLWHAAVNGRGAYFSATDPTSLANGLANALVSIQSKVGSAAAAATSTLNPVAGNNKAFVASYTTLKWTGNLEARGINTDTGVVNENADWCVENVAAASCAAPGSIVSDSSGDTTAYSCSTPNSVVCPGGTLDGTDCKVPIATACTGTMNAKVSALSDTRTIYTAAHNSTVSGVSVTDGSVLVPFDTAFRGANSSYFNATLLAGLSQWPPDSDTSATAVAFRANAPGDNLLNYLRGQNGHEYDRSTVATIDQFFRNRDRVMGDALESQPAFMGAPVFSYPYPGYAEFKTAQASRAGTVYMGTNDGMMHAFNADTGAERWAYVPSMVVPNLWKLADKLYSDKHTNYVNGSPITSDVCTSNCSNTYNVSTPSTNPVWKTILVAGLNGGGRGYFALDITNPDSPSLLWEFTTTSGIGKVKDDDLGYSFGQPVITRRADGKWVVLVTSGYDNGTDSATKVSGSFVANSPAGDGKGYLYVLDAATGAILSKISTGVGSAANPSGLAKIAGFNVESAGNKVSYVYGGDLLGNLWRFDINDNGTTAAVGTGSALKFATLFSDSAATQPQPIMTTPILALISGKRVVFVGTGKYLEIGDLGTTQKQTQYAIQDPDASATLVNPRTSLVQQFLINNPDGTATRLSAASAGATTTGANTVDFGITRGWFVDLPDSRERVNIDAKLVEGTLLVPTIVPSATDCSPGGSGWLNFFDYRTGAAVEPQPGIAGVKYDSTIVGLNVLFIAGKPVVEVVTSTNPTPSIDPSVQFAASAAGFAGKRVLWRELVP